MQAPLYHPLRGSENDSLEPRRTSTDARDRECNEIIDDIYLQQDIRNRYGISRINLQSSIALPFGLEN